MKYFRLFIKVKKVHVKWSLNVNKIFCHNFLSKKLDTF